MHRLRTATSAVPNVRCKLLTVAILISGFLAPVTAYAGKAYWLWAGIPIPKDASSADVIYLHQGHVRQSPAGVPAIVQLGLAPFPAHFRRVVLVYRFASLVEPKNVLPAILVKARAWERNGVSVSGVQIDFDASTLRLPRYADFLKSFRAQLPRQYTLSVTGLADWGTTAPMGDLDLVIGVVDEIDFQMYRGKLPVPDWQIYAQSLVRMKSPFRIGMLESMSPSPTLAASLAANPNYLGPNYFVLTEPRREKQ
jgi:hypothetical protein